VRVAPSEDGWLAELLARDGSPRALRTRAVVNATGPWVGHFLRSHTPIRSAGRVRLVKGSHIVIARRLPGARALLLQNDDGRVVFVIPFEHAFALIGTTDVPVSDPGEATVSAAEVEYLCCAANRYLAQPVKPADAVWSMSGIRALYDDGSHDPSKVSRDYVLQLDRADNGAPLLSVFGGKLTTYRRLSEEAVARLAPAFASLGPSWTAQAALPGGDLGGLSLARWCGHLERRHPGLPAGWVSAIARRHGACADAVLGDARRPEDLGTHFGASLTARELDYLVGHEWAMDADDVLWRRTKTGLHMTAAQRETVRQALAGA
jgi:glycerol-3-phosphate dehydrogenase